MRLRPDTLALTVLLAALTSLGPLSTDMYLPSLPTIAGAFGRSPAEVQWTLSAFLLGFAAGQVFYGPLADRHGRRPVLLAGLTLFTVATAACALAPNLEVLTGARFLQALGASGPIVLARSIVRDLYAMERAGRELARMGTIMGFVPAIAPVIGGVLEAGFGWRASFVATVFFGAATLAVCALFLPETLKARAPDPVSLRRIAVVFADLARHAGYRSYVILACCTYGGLFAFISGSSYVLQGVYGLTPTQFGLAFGLGVVGYISGTVIAQRIVGRRGLEGTIAVGALLMALGGVGCLAGTAFGPAHFLALLLPMMIYTAGVGLTLPQAIAGAMTPFPDRAGAASSFLGMCQMSFAAAVGLGVGHSLGGAAWPLGLAIALLGSASLVTYHATSAARRDTLLAARAAER